MIPLIPLAHFGCALVLMRVVNWLGLYSWQRTADAHWTERARLLWPARITSATNLFLIPVILMLTQLWLFPKTESWQVINGLAACAGTLLACYPFDRSIYPQLDFRNWLHQALVGWGLRFAIYVALIVAGILMPAQYSWQMIAVAGGYLIFHAALQWGLLLKYLRWVKFLTPAGERLQRIVKETSAQMGTSARAVWELGGVAAYAFAFPTTRELAMSKKLLDLCDDEEVAAICSHELAHLTESKTVLVLRLLGSLSLFPIIFISPSASWFGTFGMLIPFLAVFLIAHFTRRFSQRMEKRADAEAVKQQSNEGVYARALEKLYRENLLPAVNASDRHTHPHLYDRMIAAGITPDYPRPARPEKATWPGVITYFVLGLIFAMLVMRG